MKSAKNLKGSIILLIAAMIWGFAFVAQDVAAEIIEPFTLNGVRFIIGSVALLPVILVMSKKTGRPLLEKTKEDRKVLIKAGVLCGVFLCIAANIQQFGIAIYPPEAASSGRSGFITALYVVLVPIFGIFLKKKIGLNVWVSVALATVGMYLLCFAEGISGIYLGDIIVLCCAFGFTLQIMCIDKYGSLVDGVKLSCIEFFISGVLSLVLMFIFETPEIAGILSAWKQLIFLGVFSSGVAYTFQIIGQQNMENPTVASIIMSLESVFAAIGGVLLLNESMTVREIFGCVIMFSAIILSQLPAKPKAKVLTLK